MRVTYITTNDVPMPALRRRIITHWLDEVAREYGFGLSEICYNFTDDEGILEANIQFLDHHYYTDVITFDSRTDTDEPVVCGDLLISLETVRTNADGLGINHEEELHRVMVHGVLHLLGLDDHCDADRAVMRQAEDKALQRLHQMIGNRPLLTANYPIVISHE